MTDRTTAGPDRPKTGTKDKSSRARNISPRLRGLFEHAFLDVVRDLVAQILLDLGLNLIFIERIDRSGIQRRFGRRNSR